MPNLQTGARLASSSPLPGRAAEDAEFAQFPTLQCALDPLEAAFEDDLAMWLARLYARREEQRLMGQLERVYGVGVARDHGVDPGRAPLRGVRGVRGTAAAGRHASAGLEGRHSQPRAIRPTAPGGCARDDCSERPSDVRTGRACAASASHESLASRVAAGHADVVARGVARGTLVRAIGQLEAAV